MTKLEIVAIIWGVVTTICCVILLIKVNELDRTLDFSLKLVEDQHKVICILRGEDPTLPWEEKKP